MPAQSVIILTDSLRAMENSKTTVDLSVNVDSNRSELKQLSIEQDGNALQLKKTRQNYLPALSLFANYTQLYQGPEFKYSDNFYWAPVNYIGVRLAIPITGSIKNINSVKECKFKISLTDFNLKQKTVDVEYEIQQAITKLSNAEKNLFVAKDNYTLSQRVYELKKQQFNLGSFSYEKLLDTEKSLAATEQDYIIAVYDFLIAKINYKKAIGSF
jgi:outer membrane protein TolC